MSRSTIMDLILMRGSWIYVKPEENTVVYMSSMLTSKKPFFVPMGIWRRLNACINRAITFPIYLYYRICKGFHIVYPGNCQGPLIAHYGIDGDILSFWLECIEDGDFDIIVKGWRADASPGATAELQIARRLGLPIKNVLGRQPS